MSERPGIRTAAAVLLSLLANGALIALLARAGAFHAPRPSAAPRPIALAPLTADQWEANRAIAGKAPPVPPVRPPELPDAVPPPPKEHERPKGQIVDVAPSPDSRRPEDSRFLSDRDNTVEKETRSRFAGTQRWENTLPSPSTGARRKPAEPAPGEAGAADRSKPGKEAPKAGGTGAEKLAVPDQKQQERLALSTRPEAAGPGDLTVAPKRDRERIAGGAPRLELPGEPGEEDGGGQRRTGRLDPRLLPDAESMARIAGGPAPDRLDGLDEGDATALNTRSFKYATYITRVSRAIYERWEPNQAYQARDPDGRMFPMRDRTTVVEVVLDAQGNLAEVKVLGQSGLDFLDEEVVRAVRTASPFPNPPPGLVEHGKVRLALGYTLMFRGAGRVQFVPADPRVFQQLLPSQQPYPQR